MNNRRNATAPAAPVPAFFRALRAMMSQVVKNEETNIYQFNDVIEDMFVTLGIYSRDANGNPIADFRTVNAQKYQQIATIRGIIKAILEGKFRGDEDENVFTNRVHIEGANLDRFGLVNIERSTFRDLIMSYEANYPQGGDFISKLLIFLSRIYSDEGLFQSLEGRYPFKIIFSVDPQISVTRLVNNAQELRNLLVESFFRMIASADFLFQTRGGGIEYYNDPVPDDGDINIDEEVIDGVVHYAAQNVNPNALVLNRIRGANISMLFMQYSRLAQGRCMPKQLKLPNLLARSVICPDNKDDFCLVYCLIIASKIMRDKEKYAKITNKLSLNKIEAFPEINAAFNEVEDEVLELYSEDDNYISIDEETLSQLELIFNININVYTILDSDASKVDIIFRSSFSNVDNNDVARLLYVPYCNMVPLKKESNVKDFGLGEKSKADLCKELNDHTFFEANNGHFCLIPPTSSLITGEKTSNNYFLCPYCDTTFRGVKIFESHKEECLKLKRTGDRYQTTMVENPHGASQIFNKYYTLSKSPFVIYGDTETKTDATGHKLFSYFLYAKHSTDPEKDLFLEDCAESEEEVGEFMIKQFVTSLTIIRMHIKKNTNLYPLLNEDECELFELQNERVNCKFCGKVPRNKKTKLPDPECLVIHHDHNKKSPNIVGYLCQSCNIKESKINKSFPLVFHNLPYDLLVLIKILAVKEIELNHKGKDVICSLNVPSRVLARTSMKYSSLTLLAEKMICQTEDLQTYQVELPEIRFIDSYAFFQESLSKVVELMSDGVENLKATFPTTWRYIKKVYPEIAVELFGFSTQKGTIAYTHTSVVSMKSKTNLPKDCYKNDLDFTEGFYENLKEKEPERYIRLNAYRIRQAEELEVDYARANEIFAILKKKFKDEMTYREYFLFYQNLDVLLLADSFEWFRNTLIPTHKLDPAWFIGLPSYSQNCMLYKTKKELHLIEENLELSKLITENLRGGLSVIVNKFAENFDRNPKKHICGIDINNLYGYVMQFLKVANKFIGEIPIEQWEDETENFNRNGKFTYFLLTDVDCSDKVLQDRVSQLPPLVSKKNIDFSHLSKNQKQHKAENYRSEKLCCTLENQTDYLMHQQNFLFYESLGYKIKVKRVFKFEQDYIYREYIEMNSKLRQASTSEFAKVLYKALNNIIYGKSLQRNDLRDDIEILSDPKIILKRMISPRLKKIDIIKDDELIMANTIPREAKFDTCVQAGFTILELSKLHIYSMLYIAIKPFCDENKVKFRILLSDTDSLYLEYDFSDSPFENYNQYMLALQKATNILDMHSFKDPLLHDNSRKKQVGLFLDEEGDQQAIISIVSLCSKSYCYIKEHIDGEKKGKRETVFKGKGVSKRYLEASYTFEDYRACSNGELPEEVLRLEFNNIQRRNYQNVTATINKIALSNFDDKMFHYKDESGVWKSLPYGHYKIADINAVQEDVDFEELCRD